MLAPNILVSSNLICLYVVVKFNIYRRHYWVMDKTGENMADVEVNVYVTEKEYNNHSYDGAHLVKDALEEGAQFRNLTTNIDVIQNPQYVGGQNAGCDDDPWYTWKNMVNENDIPDKARSNLLLTNRGYTDDGNLDGCGEYGGKAAMMEGGKDLANITSTSDVPRFRDTHHEFHTPFHWFCAALMEVGHNYGGRHDDPSGAGHHGNDTFENDKFYWSPIVHGYSELEGDENNCQLGSLDTLGGWDRYYGACMADEIQN